VIFRLSFSRYAPSWLFALVIALPVFAILAPCTAAKSASSDEKSTPAAAGSATVGSPSNTAAGAEANRDAAARHAPEDTEPKCSSGMLPQGDGKDIEINGTCTVGLGTYHYHNINIVKNGVLRFMDAKIDLWAESILVEAGGAMVAGSVTDTDCTKAITGPLTIHLWGKDQGPGGKGIACIQEHCGVPDTIWGKGDMEKRELPGRVFDYWYDYMPLHYDDGDENAYFGYKVLAVSYGGGLAFYGKKGLTCKDKGVSDSGMSWARLNASVAPGAGTELTLDRKVDWQKGDQIVVTTTDYVPDHSEQLTVKSVADGENSNSVVTISDTTPIQFPHNGEVFPLANVPKDIGPDPLDPKNPDAPRFVETRAAVALLSRSIRIVSEGNTDDETFEKEPPDYSFGGHTVFRQGFQAIDLRGVEFFHMGQGGLIQHYPVHFHMARKTPPVTQIIDCSIHDSMTRWITIHATQGVTLQRNVGYKSIGHGYYFEDGTETDNKLYSNIGILARAAVQNDVVNPRGVPGILAAKYPPWNGSDGPQEHVPFHTDADHPTIFWIMNAYNDFEYNMATGADTCGACYWLVPGFNSGASRQEKWESYASEQTGGAKAATTPLYKFKGNYCSTAMNAFNTVGNTTQCLGVVNENPGANLPQLPEVENPLAPKIGSPEADDYYPKVDLSGGRFPTTCPATGDCAAVPRCSETAETNCVITLIDRFTSSFNWAETNFSAIWLRPQWYLFLNSAVTDVQNGGLSMITGGGYTDSDAIPGHWALAYKSIFIGNAQDPSTNWYTLNAGPFNPNTDLDCARKSDGASAGSFCLSKDHGITIPLTNFAVNQRLFNIYDGPVYQDANAYLDIQPTFLTGCIPSPPPGGECPYTRWMYGPTLGVPKTTTGCYLPNAAIAWKQPNGFYYPPAFHSANLFFDDVAIRHYVVEPLFLPGTFKTDPLQTFLKYCNWNSAAFDGFSDIDRQTELNDDDGTLTGLMDTISVNFDPFFNALSETTECASDIALAKPPGTAKTSPYDYVTTVVYPYCGSTCGAVWNDDCANQHCYGVPLYREDVNMDELGAKPSIRMMAQKTGQRSNLTVNDGRYYIDTTVSEAVQRAQSSNLNVFEKEKSYTVFLAFAKTTTKQTYSLYVGSGFDDTKVAQLSLVRVLLPDKNYKVEDQKSWPDGIWTHKYDPALGVLTVTMDMTAYPLFKMDYDLAKSAHCQPHSFCKPQDSGDCGCAPGADGLDGNCQQVCSIWANKDVTCPQGGCFGFKVTLTSGFTTGSKEGLPPTTNCYPPGFKKDFVKASEEQAGSCFYAEPPPPQTCMGAE
jgi:hypothetical protein